MKNKTRKLNRYAGHDYSLPGFYFVTICTDGTKEYFGKIESGEMKLNQLGKIVLKNLENIRIYFDNIFLCEHVVMPNHVHAIFEIQSSIVGADLVSAQERTGARPVPTKRGGLLSEVVRIFKSKSAVECIKFTKENNLGKFSKVWQRSFYDRVIRNQDSLNKIRQYIERNPKFWDEDKNKVENIFY